MGEGCSVEKPLAVLSFLWEDVLLGFGIGWKEQTTVCILLIKLERLLSGWGFEKVVDRWSRKNLDNYK